MSEKKEKTVQEQIKDQQAEDLKMVLSTPSGRRVLKRIFKDCYIFSPIEDNNKKKIEHMKMGAQKAVYPIFKECIEINSELTVKLIIENELIK